MSIHLDSQRYQIIDISDGCGLKINAHEFSIFSSACANGVFAAIAVLQPYPQFAVGDRCLQYIGLDGGILLGCTGMHVEGIGVPWADDAAPLYNSFTERPSLMRADAIEHSDEPFDVGHAQCAPLDGKLGHFARRGQLGR
jgi:hypothetical protein